MTSTRNPLRAAQIRLKTATEPDREVDALIGRALYPGRCWKNSSVWMLKDEFGAGPMPAFTGDLNDAQAATEYALPGWDWWVKRMGGVYCAAIVQEHGRVVFYCQRPHSALALMTAVIDAARAREEVSALQPGQN